MNDLKQYVGASDPKTTDVSEFIDVLTRRLNGIEEQRSRLDSICNRINSEAYYKNMPQDIKCGIDKSAVERVLSNTKLDFDRIINRISDEENQIDKAINFIETFI